MTAAGKPSNQDADLVDLYGDFNDGDLDTVSETNELFDDVLTGSVNQAKGKNTNPTLSEEKPGKVKEKSSEENSSQVGDTDVQTVSSKKMSVLIGHFSWWVSEQDLLDLAGRLAVKDVTQIKFAEEKVNGVSRGYAEMIVASEESKKKLLDSVPKCKLTGEKLVCCVPTFENRYWFDEQAKKRVPSRQATNETKQSDSSAEIFTLLLSKKPSPSPAPPNFSPHSLGNTFHPSPGTSFRHPPPLFLPPPQTIPPLMGTPLFRHPYFPVSGPPPSLNLNPAYFPPVQNKDVSKAYSQQIYKPQGNDGDFEELINRNRTIASSAITKAVSGAATGELQVAMETLLTAIAIIKQSRVYRDERCQALVTSLKDCLVSIQSTYGPRDRSHSGERDRSKERDRDRHKRDKERDRDRGSSRDRERDRQRGWSRDTERGRTRDRVRDFDCDPGWKDSGLSRRHRENSWSGERDKGRPGEWARHRDHRDRYQ
ncbi:cleavage and polyadenylation specificity factor subunit 7-like [Pholidichthys leucotaenia]